MARNRVRYYTETADYARFVRRIVAAYGRRVADDAGDIAELGTLGALAGDVDAMIASTVTGLRASGHTWQEIGDALGVTRQAAQQRYGRVAA